MNFFLNSLDRSFINLHSKSKDLIRRTSSEKLFWKPTGQYPVFSCGEYILRSAGKVEQTFGGIMTRLWDDPFEWTLPEELSTNRKITEYLDEVEITRQKGFLFFESDEDLKKEIPVSDEMKPLFELLLNALNEAEKLYGQASVIYQLSSTETHK